MLSSSMYETKNQFPFDAKAFMVVWKKLLIISRL